MKSAIAYLVFISLGLNYISAQEIHQNTPRYLQQANQAFNKQDFDACIWYLYMCIYDYKQKKDSLNISNSWYEAACLQILRNKRIAAFDALALAQQFAPSHHRLNQDQKLLFNALYCYKHENYKKATAYFNEFKFIPFQIKHFKTFIQILQSRSRDLLKPYTVYKCNTEPYIQQLQKSNDTLWFGYPLTLYYTGDFYFYRNKTLQCSKYVERAIRNFENLFTMEKEWALSYERLNMSYYFINCFSEKKELFIRFTRLFPTSKHNKEFSSILDNIKAFDLAVMRNFEAECAVYLKLYYASTSDSSTKAQSLKDIFRAKVSLKKYKDAIQWFEKIPKDQLDPSFLVTIGKCYYYVGDTTKAKAFIKQCKQTMSTYDLNYLYTLSELISYYQTTSDYTMQQQILDKEIVYFRQDPNASRLIKENTYYNYGVLYWLAEHNYKNALKYFHMATYELLNTNFNANAYQLPEITKSLDDEKLISTINLEGEVFYQLSKQKHSKAEELRDLKYCYDYLNLSLQLVQKYKITLPLEEQKLTSADLYKSRYPNIIKVCLELLNKTGDSIYAEKAFEFVEKSKAALLLSLIKGIQVQKMNLLPDTLIRKEEQLRTAVAAIAEKLKIANQESQTDYAAIDQLISNKALIGKRQDSLTQFFKINYPIYYKSKYSEQVISTKSLQDKLLENEAIIQYSLSYNFMTTYVITKHTFKIFVDSVKKSFFEDVTGFQKKISSYNFEDNHDASITAFSSVSNRLYHHLIQPVVPYIQHKKLIIIPDDVLNQIPFEALVTEMPSGHNTSYKNLHYLIKDHSIVYNYSGTLYGMNCKAGIIHQTHLLGMAPLYKDIDSKGTVPKARNKTNQLFFSTIEGTFKEMDAIQSAYPNSCIIKNKATEKQFKKIAADYDIIHLAMHGVIDNEDPMFSKLIFSPANDAINEGYLNTYEIYNMHLNASLVVLSACNSGAGMLHTGEGIISLARGFFSAGAKSIVMTLWSVADKSSSHLMSSFYSNLSSQKNIGDALHDAKLKYLNEADRTSSHPYFWAGYIATGNTNIVFQPQHSNRWLYFTLTGLLFIIVPGIIFRKKLTPKAINFPWKRTNNSRKLNI